MKCSLSFSSIQFSRSVMSDSLRPHKSQHARPPCPSPTPGVHSDSLPSSPWCHPAISSYVVPFSSCPQSLPASGSFAFLKKFIYFNWRLIALQYCIGVAISTWICHGCTCVPHPEPPFHLPPHTIPLGHPSAPAPSILYPSLNLDWQFVSYMILHMFQCHSPKSSHPLPLPQSPKDCSIHLCLFCCLAYRVIITIFLCQSLWLCGSQ